MKRTVCLTVLTAVLLSANLLYAARAGRPRAETPESEPAAAAQDSSPESAADSAAQPASPEATPQEESPQPAEDTPQPQSEDGGKRGPHGRDGRRMEREPVIPIDDALAAAGKADPVRLNQPDFITDDQVQLRALYYKGNADESTVPVILLHKKDGKKEDWQDLAKTLAESGAAVLVPDLRGYGESTSAYIEDYSFGGNPPMVRPNRYLASGFSQPDWDAMRYDDGRFWIRFLVYLHNKKMLNIRKLVLIGDGYGAAVAGCWLMEDWKAPSPKKGQFVRGLLMISPEADEIFERLGSGKTKAGKITYKIYVGGLDKERLEAAETIGLQLAKEKSSTPAGERKVPVENCKTEKQSVPLVKASSFNMPQQILQFLSEDCQPETGSQKWQAIKNFE